MLTWMLVGSTENPFPLIEILWPEVKPKLGLKLETAGSTACSYHSSTRDGFLIV